MTIFPLDENDLPSYKTSLGFFTALGAGTVIWANLIHNLPFYNRPAKIAVGALLGCLGGHVLHGESTRAWGQLRLRDEYRDRLAYQAQRDLAKGEEAGRGGSEGSTML